MILEYFKLAVNNITHRKVRSWLTIIGIIIGIASIIALISLSLGLQNSIAEQFESFGSDKILVSAATFQGPGSLSIGLTEKDVETVKKIQEFKVVAPFIAKPGSVEYKGESKFPIIFGGQPKESAELFADTRTLEKGRYLKEGDHYDAILGSRAAKKLFKKEIRINNKIKINGKEFKVVGIFEEVGNQQDDSAISIPLDTFKEIFKSGDQIDFISAQVKPGSNIPEVQKKLERLLKDKRGDENFNVVTPTQILEQISQVLGIVQAVLVGIAAISLVVGGIGIMNSMYTSVLERTRDIGVMKAIGAKDSDILKIFLIESGLMGFVGGIFGVVLGTLLSLGIGQYATEAGFKLLVTINPQLMLFGLFFAFIAGIISGVLPAYRASQLNPVEALRHE
ncbi:ABC transporter permease [Candidatus Woesearchaeota archaeon]|nr:ABC transporter permease [Candidatus Woesearchaeota archaeon]